MTTHLEEGSPSYPPLAGGSLGTDSQACGAVSVTPFASNGFFHAFGGPAQQALVCQTITEWLLAQLTPCSRAGLLGSVSAGLCCW